MIGRVFHVVSAIRGTSCIFRVSLSGWFAPTAIWSENNLAQTHSLRSHKPQNIKVVQEIGSVDDNPGYNDTLNSV